MLAKLNMICVVLMLALGTISISGFAQTPADAVARVPELDAFHNVIYRIWHEAYPEKDIEMLRQLLPDVEKGISEVAAARLPGILREKKTAWEEGVRKLRDAGADYRTAVSSKDDARMLEAAETLHSRFEMLMRTTRPALRELDDFHSTLYMLYHHYLPEYDLEKIRSSVSELKKKMKALDEVQLPARLKEESSEFQAARSRLSASVNSLESAVRSSNQKIIKDAVEKMHSNYQALNKIFE